MNIDPVALQRWLFKAFKKMEADESDWNWINTNSGDQYIGIDTHGGDLDLKHLAELVAQETSRDDTSTA